MTDRINNLSFLLVTRMVGGFGISFTAEFADPFTQRFSEKRSFIPKNISSPAGKALPRCPT